MRACAAVLICWFGILAMMPTAIAADHRPQQPVASRAPAPDRVLEMTATEYSYSGKRTFTGAWPKEGTVAVDPRVVPLGSHLWVQGYGPAVATDTGAAIQGDKIDLFKERVPDCWKYGRREVTVRILN